MLLPMPDNASAIQTKNIEALRNDMSIRYFDAPDLYQVDKNAYRFINAVSDFATHAKPLKETSTYKENLFSKTMDGNPLIDKSYEIINALRFSETVDIGIPVRMLSASTSVRVAT